MLHQYKTSSNSVVLYRCIQFFSVSESRGGDYKITICWGAAPCSLGEVTHHSDDEGSNYLRNVGQYVTENTA
jgi:hypothetical protein